MKTIIDNLISQIAPHQCIACGREGYVLCDQCCLSAGDQPVSRCAGCRILSKNWETCLKCRKWMPIKRLVIATSYSGIYEKLVKSLKFDSRRSAAAPMAKIMSNVIVWGFGNVVICPIPTASSRIRQRGFDHAKLLANEYLNRYKTFSRSENIEILRLLGRYTNVRQLGSSRQQRIRQMQKEFYAVNADKIKNKNIVLIDDVFTTGATLASAAKVLREAGAKTVSAIVFAHG